MFQCFGVEQKLKGLDCCFHLGCFKIKKFMWELNVNVINASEGGRIWTHIFFLPKFIPTMLPTYSHGRWCKFHSLIIKNKVRIDLDIPHEPPPLGLYKKLISFSLWYVTMNFVTKQHNWREFTKKFPQAIDSQEIWKE